MRFFNAFNDTHSREGNGKFLLEFAQDVYGNMQFRMEEEYCGSSSHCQRERIVFRSKWASLLLDCTQQMATKTSYCCNEVKLIKEMYKKKLAIKRPYKNVGLILFCLSF